MSWFKNIFSKKEEKPVEYPVFNLEITRDKTIYPDLIDIDETSKYIGEFVVYNSGKLIPARNSHLHTYKAELGYCEDHIHFPSGYSVDIRTKKEKPCFNGRFDIQNFTLEGFYSNIGGKNIPNLEEIFLERIKKSGRNFQFNSIATQEKTRVKLLERAYKENVSNQ